MSWLIMGLVIWAVATFVWVIVYWLANTSKELGATDERRKAAENRVKKTSRAMEILSSAPLNRRDLIKRWMRRKNS